MDRIESGMLLNAKARLVTVEVAGLFFWARMLARRELSRARAHHRLIMAAPLTDLQHLHGKVVLVRSAKDNELPTTGRRGTIDVQKSDPGKPPVVRVILEFPDMFNVPSHERMITLDERGLHQLLESEREGTYELVTADELD